MKRVCCEELKRNTSNFIHKTFPNIGVSIPAMELHALAQRRTKADSQLEHRLQMEEQSRFRMLLNMLFLSLFLNGQAEIFAL